MHFSYFVLAATAIATADAWNVIGTSQADAAGKSTFSASGKGIQNCKSVSTTESFTFSTAADDFKSNGLEPELFIYTDASCKSGQTSLRVYNAGLAIISGYGSAQSYKSYIVVSN